MSAVSSALDLGLSLTGARGNFLGYVHGVPSSGQLGDVAIESVSPADAVYVCTGNGQFITVGGPGLGAEVTFNVPANLQPPAAATFLQFAQSPQTGGIVVATSADNTGGATYGSGMFNGAMQIFRPSNTATRDNAMPWLLFGDEARNETFTIFGTQTYTPPAASSYTTFQESIAGDVSLRGFGKASQAIRFGFSDGVNGAGPTHLNYSVLAIKNGVYGSGGAAGNVNGVDLTGGATGTAPAFLFRGNDPNVSGVFQTQGTGSLMALNATQPIFYFSNNVNPAAATAVGFIGSVVTAGQVFSNTGAGDIVFANYNAGKLHIGSAAGGGFSSFQVLQGGATQVNGVRAFGSAAGAAAGISVVGNDANINLWLAPKGSGVVNFGNAMTALGGGAAPTFGTIGGSGPTAAAQAGWHQIQENGVTGWVPVWR